MCFLDHEVLVVALREDVDVGVGGRRVLLEEVEREEVVVRHVESAARSAGRSRRRHDRIPGLAGLNVRMLVSKTRS